MLCSIWCDFVLRMFAMCYVLLLYCDVVLVVVATCCSLLIYDEVWWYPWLSFSYCYLWLCVVMC